MEGPHSDRDPTESRPSPANRSRRRARARRFGLNRWSRAPTLGVPPQHVRRRIRRREPTLLLAVDPLSAGWKTLVFLIAFVLFVAGGVGYKPWGERVRLEALGLAAFVFPFFWDSWAAY